MTRITVGLAIVSAILGASVFVWMLTTIEPVIESGVSRTVSGLSVTVVDSTFLVHDHGGHDHGDEDNAEAISEATAQAQVFPMPATMTPGMPDEGTTRLQFNVIMENAGSAPTNVAPWNFHLLSGDGQVWTPLLGGTLREDTLQASQVLGTVVAFDVPDLEFENTSLNLVWLRSNQETRFAVTEFDHDDEH